MKKLGNINTLPSAAGWLAQVLDDSGFTPEFLIELGRQQRLPFYVAIDPNDICPPPQGEGFGLRTTFLDGIADFTALDCHVLQAQGSVSTDEVDHKGHSFRLRRTIQITADMVRVTRRDLEHFVSYISAIRPNTSPTFLSPNTQSTKQHHIKGKTSTLDAVFATIKDQITPTTDYQTAWALLVKLASSKEPPAPLVGMSSGEGIQYMGNLHAKSGEYDILEKRNFIAAFKRRLANQETK